VDKSTDIRLKEFLEIHSTGGNGRLSIGHFYGSTVAEIGYINVGAGIQAQYVGPEKHQYRSWIIVLYLDDF
jgi:hypothetical protein